jgi:hypothetical protein
MKPDLLDGSDLQAYDELVAESDEGTLFQTSWWHQITDAAYGGSISTEQYGYFENGRLVAAIPISTYRKFGRSFVFNSKLTPYSGPIFFNKPDAKVVTKNSRQKSVNGEFAKLIKEKGTCIGYPFGPAHTDLQPYLWNGFSIGVNYHYVLDIDDLTTIESNFDKPKRAELRQAQKYGLEVKFGDVHDFIELNNETMKRQNHPLFPPELWETIYRESRARGCGEVFTAYDENGPLGSLLLVWDNKRSYHLGSGISATSRVANTLLTWEVIQFSKERLNLAQYDFLGSSVPSIESFMRQFGGTLHPLFYIYERSLKRELVMAMRSRLTPSS